MGKESIKMIANNKKARHDYFLEELYEAGISLHGTEVKSLRMENAISRSLSYTLNMGKSSYMVCISAHMKRETFLTVIRFARRSF